ncbi:hypothetical protein [Tsuneonella sp. SYSU-LHT278]|uniref:hypothetical protein n=1 Tax=Tsuneonella sediminis TaxID=3416089 RepID=UPI003F7AECC8
MKENIEPLDPATWFGEVARVDRARRAQGRSIAALLRRVFYLVCLAPAELRGVIRTGLTEDALERWLELGATASAALALIDPPSRVSLVRDAARDRVTVEVELLGSGAPGTASDNDIAAALLGAWCRAILAIGERAQGCGTPGTTHAVTLDS